ncbi:MAG: C13 family peptidase [Hyphomonadaceae bacterium]
MALALKAKGRSEAALAPRQTAAQMNRAGKAGAGMRMRRLGRSQYKSAWLNMVQAACVAGAVFLTALPGASAQTNPQQRDPFNGQFGVLEVAMPPRMAARQQALFQTALNALQPQRPGQTDVYLVVAAFWNDPVFENEARQAAEILTQRLGAQNRTLILTSGTGGLERTYPVSSPFHLNAALGHIGEMINPEEDMVVLFLTSHGSPDGSIAIRETGRMGGALRPVNLRDSLADAGIRNRVVIVSACFAGAFIAPLMNENTIVLTAAAPDRTSFGCQPDREWTYFGDAFLGHAVRGGAGLVAGFDQATQLIAQWERAQRLTPSNPQKHVGARAAEMLARVERAAAR